MAVGPWGELIKQGFENFRNGLNTLSNGMSSAGQIFGNGTSFQPVQTQTQPLNTSTNGALSNSNLAQVFKPAEQKNTGAIGSAIQKEAPSANSMLYDYLMR